ncbi:helix-turn-helix domain-containing protein [Elizabethkingia sp. HX WHF]|uniref:helix-turn-helix domain-containing protein n=1 Tax=Elizabethkingia TaxID=308865 RepID=UPI000999FD6E|nr:MULTISPECIES: helix-turn-helix domain-containing protein [Elizabethkingia]ATL42482.1 AraC family transcriptional regulator [Elizabethkingia miricola]MCL1637013.1 helix-turn-helix domain-containing protein [Elizabethkingia bruuniana]MDX8563752.1 helix-turn-helix domain-containing protein [Elizabethkingia sp. HX WHF]OPC20191.1 transcriptional regulator [Elizabethkingia bruuniana]
MSIKYNIPAFLQYINLEKPKNDKVHVASYVHGNQVLRKSNPIEVDFYMLAIKINPNDVQPEEMSDAFAYFDRPDNALEWDFEISFTGYGIFVCKELLDKYAKEYNFMNYNNHEALFLTWEEKQILMDLFEKAYQEYEKENYAQGIIISYASLVLSYVESFYKRQFESRKTAYNKVVDDFYLRLNAYFNENQDTITLPSVTYFAEKANLSANYFGDVIKHFTGISPQDHIRDNIIQTAKNKLSQTSLSVSEIAYSLGFDYPTYFTRFFRKETGFTPSVYRNQ